MDPNKVCLYVPNGLANFKKHLFERIANRIRAAGGKACYGNPGELDTYARSGVIPIIGCSPELREFIIKWRAENIPWIYWDRGYARRVFATWLPRGQDGGYYRWHVGSFQMQHIKDRPDDRWKYLDTTVTPWAVNPRGHVVIAAPSRTYGKFHGLSNWTEEVIRHVTLVTKATKRQIVVRDKESYRSLQDDLKGAYCLVTHGSNTAVEAVIAGCPVVVHPDSAAALVGITDIEKLEKVVYPDRGPWLRALAYCQFNETELIDGTLWRLIDAP